jgi:electron transfer flavoprotein beta subunit
VKRDVRQEFSMNIIVCMKQVPDPEGPQDCFVINTAAKRVEPRGIPPVLSLFDENALEAALRIRDAGREGVKITVLSAGKRLSEAVLQKALAAGADALVKVEGEVFDSALLDSHATATALTSAIAKIGAYDLILTGRQAADWNAGQVGIGIAHRLGIPAITMARKVEIAPEGIVVERVLPNGYEVVKAPLPALVAASNEIGMMRYPTLIQRRDAKKKPVTSWGAIDIGFADECPRRILLKRLLPAVTPQRPCEIIQGETPADAGRNLALRLRQDRIL